MKLALLPAAAARPVAALTAVSQRYGKVAALDGGEPGDPGRAAWSA